MKVVFFLAAHPEMGKQVIGGMNPDISGVRIALRSINPGIPLVVQRYLFPYFTT